MSPSVTLMWPFVWPKPQGFCMKQIDTRAKQQGIASQAYCHNKHTWTTLVQHNQYLWDRASCRSDMPISMRLASVVDQQTTLWLFRFSPILFNPVPMSFLLVSLHRSPPLWKNHFQRNVCPWIKSLAVESSTRLGGQWNNAHFWKGWVARWLILLTPPPVPYTLELGKHKQTCQPFYSSKAQKQTSSREEKDTTTKEPLSLPLAFNGQSCFLFFSTRLPLFRSRHERSCRQMEGHKAVCPLESGFVL